MNRIEQALCRIREKLPNNEGFVTHGVGCAVKHEGLAASLGWKCPNLIVTSVDVLTPEHLASDRIYLAEFLVFDKKGYEVFELKAAAEFCKAIRGRIFEEDDGEGETSQQPNEQLITVISVEPLDKRGFLKRMVKKSSLQNIRPVDSFDFEKLESELAAEGIFCNVIREFGSCAQEFESRTYKFKYSAGKRHYLLEDFGHRHVELEVRSFPDDQILAGGIVFSKQGLYLGCLGYSPGQILPSFMPDAYLQQQGAETLEETPEREEQVADEVVATVPDNNEKNHSTDENENKDLLEKGFEVANNMEEQSSGSDNAISKEPDTETSNDEDQQEEMPDTSQSEHVEGHEEQEEDTCENVKQESENSEQISEETNLESVENSPRISEVKELRRDSSDLDFVISVSHDGKETSERDDSIPEETAANSDEIEDNSINNGESSIEEATDIHGEIATETEVIEETTHFENEEKVEHESEEEIQNTIEENQENTAESVADTPQEYTPVDHKNDTTNVDQNNIITDDIIGESDVVAIEIQPDSDIREPSEEGIEIEESCAPVEVAQEEDKYFQSELNVTEGSDNTLEADVELHGVEIMSEKDNDTVIEADVMDNTYEDNTSAQECKDDENVSSLDQVQAVEQEDELQLVETLPTQQDVTEENQEHVKEETQEEGHEITPEVIINEGTSEQENTSQDIESQIPAEPKDPQNQPEDDLMKHVDAVHENLSIEPDSPDGIQMDVKKDIVELEESVIQEPGDPLEPDDLLSTKITDNPKALEDLSLLLDTEYQHGGVSSWHDLAELLAIPKEAYDHCLAFSKPSATEDLMVFLANTKPQFTISDLKDALRAASRGDAVHLIDRYIARAIISGETVIQGIIERDDIDLLGGLALKLDRGQQNWKILARHLDVPSRIFRNFGSHQRQNSALLMLKYLPIFDPDFTVESLKDVCQTVGFVEVVKFLEASGIPGEDAIMDILEDTDAIDELTDLLNEEDETGPHWKTLGRKLNIPEEKFSIFEPSKQNSPTKLLLQSIAQCEPDITVDELILALVAMKRHDVIETLGKHFRNSDIRSILEENNCLPPQPETPRKDGKDDDESIA